jgi:hypothetical protein
VPGLRRGKQELAAGALTPSILVRIHVPQPGILPLRSVSAIFVERAQSQWLALPETVSAPFGGRVDAVSRPVLGPSLWRAFSNLRDFCCATSETGSQ